MDEQLLRNLFEEEHAHWWHMAKLELILGFIPSQNHRVLVLGVGGGLLCHKLATLGFEVRGVDISPDCCHHVQQTYGVNVIQHDLENGLPFEDNSFDAVIIADVLEHIQKDKELAAEIYRCLAKGGRLLLTVPAYQHLWSYWDELLAHFRRYRREGLRSLITNAGFKIRKISYFNVLIYPAALVWRKCFFSHGQRPLDFSISKGGAVMSFLMRNYYAIERFWISFAPLPFGLSLFVYAEK